MMRRHHSSVASKKCSVGLTIPALLTSTSIRPCSAMTESTMAPTCALSDTSAGAAIAVPPRSEIACAVAAAASPSMSFAATADPAVAKRSAMALPMPRPAPVTRTTVPLKESCIYPPP